MIDLSLVDTFELTIWVLAYHLILWRVWVNTCLDGKEKEFMLDWAPWRSVPQVIPRRPGYTEKKAQ